MIRKPGPDLLLYVLAAISTVVGLLSIWDAGYARAAVNSLLLPREFQMQAVFAVGAVLIGLAAAKVPGDRWKDLALPGLLLSVVCLFLVELPVIGKEIGGARRWIDFRIFTVQPAEFAKLSVILFLAWALAMRKPWKEPRVRSMGDRIDKIWLPKLWRGLLLLGPVGVVVWFIEHEPDMATAMVIVFVMLAMFVLGGVTWKSIGSVILCGLALIGVMLMKEGYRLDRITNHGDRWSSKNIEGIGYQTTQSEIALANGGALGMGLGEGRAKHKLPAPTTDFILATIGEEFGFVGSLGVIVLLGWMTFRMFMMGLARNDAFGRLVICGIASWIGVQSATNIMMANGYFPPIGVPLPFFSYGGSSLVALWLAVGVTQSILSSKGISDKAVIDAEERSFRRSTTKGVRNRNGGVTREREAVLR